MAGCSLPLIFSCFSLYIFFSLLAPFLLSSALFESTFSFLLSCSCCTVVLQWLCLSVYKRYHKNLERVWLIVTCSDSVIIFNQASTIVAVSMLAMRKDENLFKSNLYVFFFFDFYSSSSSSAQFLGNYFVPPEINRTPLSDWHSNLTLSGWHDWKACPTIYQSSPL